MVTCCQTFWSIENLCYCITLTCKVFITRMVIVHSISLAKVANIICIHFTLNSPGAFISLHTSNNNTCTSKYNIHTPHILYIWRYSFLCGSQMEIYIQFMYEKSSIPLSIYPQISSSSWPSTVAWNYSIACPNFFISHTKWTSFTNHQPNISPTPAAAPFESHIIRRKEKKQKKKKKTKIAKIYLLGRNARQKKKLLEKPHIYIYRERERIRNNTCLHNER